MRNLDLVKPAKEFALISGPNPACVIQVDKELDSPLQGRERKAELRVARLRILFKLVWKFGYSRLYLLSKKP